MQYYRNHKEEIKQQKKEYYCKNKNDILLRAIERRKHAGHEVCACGGKYYSSTRKKHEQTAKHQIYLRLKSETNEDKNQTDLKE